MAAKNGHYLVVKFLLEQNANAAIANIDGKTPLDFCLESIKKEAPQTKRET
jgi:ankyrin repeat protein